MSDAFALSDRTIVDYLRRRPAATVTDLVQFTGVTATAVRHRLSRLMDNGLVQRSATAAGRGRPTHRYSLTPAGLRSGGAHYDDLAHVLWDEMRNVRDPEIRRGLLTRIAARLADRYRGQIRGATLDERMSELAALMAAQDVSFEIDNSDQLPVLTALACPYPALAEQDRGICAMEKMLLSDVLGEALKLSSCRLDGAPCCTFEVSGTAVN